MSVKEQSEGLRSAYTAGRNYLAEKAMDLGGASTSPEAKDILHNQLNERLTRGLGQVLPLPPETSAGLVDAAYLGNEALTGAIAVPAGRDFFSKYGFNTADLFRNKAGQEAGIAALRQEEEQYPNYLPGPLSTPLTTVPLGLRKLAGQGVSWLMGD